MAQKVTIIVNDHTGDFGALRQKELVYRTTGTFTIEYVGDEIEFIKLIDSEKAGFRLIAATFNELTLEDN